MDNGKTIFAIGSFIALIAMIGSLYQNIPVGGGTPTNSTLAATSTALRTAEETYKSKYGKYLQVIQGSSTKIVFGKDVAPGVEVDEYVSPTGPGYVIRWRDEKGFHSKGYGPEASYRTYDVLSATSTNI